MERQVILLPTRAFIGKLSMYICQVNTHKSQAATEVHNKNKSFQKWYIEYGWQVIKNQYACIGPILVYKLYILGPWSDSFYLPSTHVWNHLETGIILQYHQWFSKHLRLFPLPSTPVWNHLETAFIIQYHPWFSTHYKKTPFTSTPVLSYLESLFVIQYHT